MTLNYPKPSLLFYFRIGIVFLIGQSEEIEEQEFIKRENKVFGDILQSEVPDLYKYLPEKVMLN